MGGAEWKIIYSYFHSVVAFTAAAESGMPVVRAVTYLIALFLIICCSFPLIFKLDYLDFNTTKRVI